MERLATEAKDDSFKATPMSTSIPLESFTVFPNLPFELRAEIWLRAAFGVTPRIVEVIISTDNSKPLCHTPSPAVLSVCHDSRMASLQAFEEVCYGGQQAGAMINTERDTLYLNTDIESAKRLSTSSFKQEELMYKVHRLAMSRVYFYGGFLAINGYRRFCEFKNIEELLVVIDKETIGGQPSERTSFHSAFPESIGYRKYQRTGDHLAYAMWKIPHIQ